MGFSRGSITGTRFRDALCEEIRGFLSELRAEVSEAEVNEIPRLLGREQFSYDEYAKAFAVHYLWPNVFKTSEALTRAGIYGRSIVDLGSGPGSAAIGALLACPEPL